MNVYPLSTNVSIHDETNTMVAYANEDMIMDFPRIVSEPDVPDMNVGDYEYDDEPLPWNEPIEFKLDDIRHILTCELSHEEKHEIPFVSSYRSEFMPSEFHHQNFCSQYCIAERQPYQEYTSDDIHTAHDFSFRNKLLFHLYMKNENISEPFSSHDKSVNPNSNEIQRDSLQMDHTSSKYYIYHNKENKTTLGNAYNFHSIHDEGTAMLRAKAPCGDEKNKSLSTTNNRFSCADQDLIQDTKMKSSSDSTTITCHANYRKKHPKLYKSKRKQRPKVEVLPFSSGPIEQVKCVDVLCGRGGRTNGHYGNVRFRQIVCRFRPIYMHHTTPKLQKAHIAAHIVREIRNLGGRFLMEDPQGSGIWYEVGDVRAVRKAGQALREDETNNQSMRHYSRRVRHMQR